MSNLHSKSYSRPIAGGLLLLTLAIALAACGGAAAPAAVSTAAAPIQAAAPATRAVANTPVAGSSGKGGGPASAVTVTGAPGRAAATAVPVKNPAGSGNCAAADEAYQEFAFGSQLIISLRSDDAYAGLVTRTGFMSLDTAALRANLAVLAKLPDAVNDSGDKTSAIIATSRQVLDLIDSNAKSGKPFTDGSGNGQKVLDIWMPLAITQRANLALVAAFSAACATYTPAPQPTSTPRPFALKTKAECAALNAAIDEFGQQAFVFAALTDDDAYGVFQPGSPFPIDLAALRADLTLFATLPDIAEVEVQYHGKPSQLLPVYRQLLAQLDANIKAGSTPFGDGSGNGQKVLDLVQAAMGDGRAEVFPATVADVCQ